MTDDFNPPYHFAPDDDERVEGYSCDTCGGDVPADEAHTTQHGDVLCDQCAWYLAQASRR